MDSDALIAVIEHPGGPNAARVEAQRAGRRPLVSPQAIKEFADGGGNINELMKYIQINKGKVGPQPDPTTVGQLMNQGVGAGDAQVIGSARKAGVPTTITMDVRLKNKVPDTEYVPNVTARDQRATPPP